MTSAKLRSARERLGMTQQQLADALGVDLRTIRRWENGEREIPPLLSASAAKMILRLSVATQRPSHTTP